jgi:hypothetical protein
MSLLFRCQTDADAAIEAFGELTPSSAVEVLVFAAKRKRVVFQVLSIPCPARCARFGARHPRATTAPRRGTRRMPLASAVHDRLAAPHTRLSKSPASTARRVRRRDSGMVSGWRQCPPASRSGAISDRRSDSLPGGAVKRPRTSHSPGSPSSHRGICWLPRSLPGSWRS